MVEVQTILPRDLLGFALHNVPPAKLDGCRMFAPVWRDIGEKFE
jgi:hypothetical protein